MEAGPCQCRNEVEFGRDDTSTLFAANSTFASPSKFYVWGSFDDRKRAIIQTTFRTFLDGRIVPQLSNRSVAWRRGPCRDTGYLGGRVLLPS